MPNTESLHPVNYTSEVVNKFEGLIDFIKRNGDAESDLVALSKSIVEQFHSTGEDQGIGAGDFSGREDFDGWFMDSILGGHLRLQSVRGADSPVDFTKHGDEIYHVHVEFSLLGRTFKVESQLVHFSGRGYESEYHALYEVVGGEEQKCLFKDDAVETLFIESMDVLMVVDRMLDCDLYRVENPLSAEKWVAVWDALSFPGTPLHAAAYYGSADLVTCLCESKAVDVNSRDEAGVTPLMVAVERFNPVMVDMLLGFGADASMADGLGRTAANRLPELLESGKRDDRREVVAEIENLLLGASVKSKNKIKRSHSTHLDGGL